MDFIQEEGRDLKNIFSRFRNKNFKGDTGQAIKNSSYQLTQNLFFKIGSLVFTIIIARMLLPERMGLYTLALSTIVLISAFSDLGLGSALITFVAKNLGLKKFGKAKAYTKFLFKWKLIFSFIAAGILLVLSYFISNNYYQKPIFFALLAGVIYIPIVSILNFTENLFKSQENFKIPLLKEIVFQVLRLIVVPLTILMFLNSSISNQGLVSVILLAIVFSYLISLLFLVLKTKKRVSFLKSKETPLNSSEKKNLKKFVYPLSFTALAGVFFGYIDTLMLGRFVSGSYIAYYGVAFSLIAGGAMLISFASTAVMPIFARRKKKSLEEIFNKTRNFVISLSIFGAVFAYLISYWIIKIAYGQEYLPAVPLLRLFSILVLFIPLLGLYNSYFVSQGRTKEVAWLLVASTILNIVFNIIGIIYGLRIGGEMGALFGALIATILSRIFYLGGFVFLKKKKIKNEK